MSCVLDGLPLQSATPRYPKRGMVTLLPQEKTTNTPQIAVRVCTKHMPHIVGFWMLFAAKDTRATIVLKTSLPKNEHENRNTPWFPTSTSLPWKTHNYFKRARGPPSLGVHRGEEGGLSTAKASGWWQSILLPEKTKHVEPRSERQLTTRTHIWRQKQTTC